MFESLEIFYWLLRKKITPSSVNIYFFKLQKYICNMNMSVIGLFVCEMVDLPMQSDLWKLW